MNRTLKTIWLTGGGVLATWLAVNPNSTTPAPSNLVRPGTATAAHQAAMDDLRVQETRLRDHSSPVPMQVSHRNPFQFGRAVKPAPVAVAGIVPAAPPAAAPAAQMSLTLAGVGERRGSQGGQRTAVISGDGQLYLVKAGDTLAGRYTVVVVDSDAVTLRDQSGAETRLSLH